MQKHNTQLTKLNSSIGLVKNDFTNQKLKIFQAYHTVKKIGDINSNDELTPLIDLVGKWRYYIGIKENLSKEELFMNVTFIRENFSELNLIDINEAINLSLKGNLDVDVEHYQNFTPFYISKILVAYKKYRSDLIVTIRQKISEKSRDIASKISDDERVDIAKKNLQFMYESREKKTFYDYGGITYDFIKRNKLVTITKELVDKAMDYGQVKCTEQIRESFYKDVIQNTNQNHKTEREKKESTIRALARNYVVKTWLSSFNESDWSKFLSKINIDML